MGAKTALLAYANSTVVEGLCQPAEVWEAETDRLVGLVHPTGTWTRRAGSTLAATYPGDRVVYAASRPGVEIVCDQSIALSRPSTLAPALIDASHGRNLVLHAMHSTVDWLAFAMWSNGRLVRSLSLAPDHGIIENIGEPMEFEQPYWTGKHLRPTHPDGASTDYPLPFHPSEMGEDALRSLFGFALEGAPHPDDIDPDRISLLGYEIADPKIS
ncbi:hypothetical protein IU474_28720 [Nocardia otitidiscaviarum]|uniref:DUF6928 family protein n=1 Tax=Nocardia otitidiscaviarum TaxID=1823 RepID=UPI00189356BB|nr:hypothetical protein [Nocardia otitidiscaviarum]MBF6241035.1 hypothetical protein [Nocardia otitidiscaviarum]